MSKTSACRLCLTEEGIMDPIFNSADTSLPQKIMECTSIEVKNLPELPSNICEICKSELIICMKFRRQCLKINDFLKTIYPHLFEYSTDEVMGKNIPERDEANDSQEEATVELYEELENENLVIEQLEDEEDINFTDSDSKLLVESLSDLEVADEASIILVEIETGTAFIDEKDVEKKVEKENTHDDGNKAQHSPKKERNKKQNDSEKVVFPDNRIRYLTKCEICGKDQQNIRQHMRIHRDEKPYKCSYCERSFRQKGNYSRHVNIHIGRKPYKCKLCDAAFADPASLRAHMVRHTGSRAYHCDVCGKSFGHSHVLAAHKRIHTQDRRHACTSCEKRFLSSHALKKHVRTHTGERPFKCKLCPKGFATSGNLRTHQRVHTKIKPFQCEICESSFSYKCVLKTHMKMHAKETRTEQEEEEGEELFVIMSQEADASENAENESPNTTDQSEDDAYDVKVDGDEVQDSA